jgi:hypothetical protein
LVITEISVIAQNIETTMGIWAGTKLPESDSQFVNLRFVSSQKSEQSLFGYSFLCFSLKTAFSITD